MAIDKDELMMNVKFNKKLAQQAQDTIDNLYKNTYYTDNKNKQYVNNLKNRMSQSINGLIDNTKLRTGTSNISDLYARVLAKNDANVTVVKDLTDSTMLSDILDLYSNNMVVRDMDREIDVVLKYLPRLQRAEDLIETAVLAADHANEEDIKINVISSIKDNEGETNLYSNVNQNNVDNMVKKYNLKKLKKTLLQKTDRYGEQFVYILSYDKALSRLLKKKNATLNSMAENGVLTEDAIEGLAEDSSIKFTAQYLSEGCDDEDCVGKLYDSTDISRDDELMLERNKDYVNSLDIEINTSGVIPSLVAKVATTKRVLAETASIIDEVSVKLDNGLAKSSQVLKNVDSQFKHFMKDSVKTLDDKAGGLEAPDGLTTDRDIKVDVPGCIVEQLDHEYVRPLYLDNRTCLGYYYIECDSKMDFGSQTTFSSTLGGLRPKRSVRDRANMDRTFEDNAVLRKIAKQISDKIDSKFINANQDLLEDIYSILKYNYDHNNGQVSKIRISFIPPEDIIHSYFDMNEHTHRGKSMFEQSLFPAKLFSCLYISNCIALLTRGYDKRIYRVRQTLDTNITAVLLNVINQIRQSNFNLRQIENMNNILNITGRFNDIVVPQSANGESPITTEILPGQNIDVKTEFMNQLEEMAVEQTGVSMEMITNHYQSEQSATNVVQNNERFLIMIREKQKAYEEILTQIMTKIYQFEYGGNDIVKVELPVPRGLSFTNTSQLLASGNDLIQSINMMVLGANPDETLKAKFSEKLMKYYYSTMLPMDDISRLRDEAEVELRSEKKSEQQGGAGGGMGY